MSSNSFRTILVLSLVLATLGLQHAATPSALAAQQAAVTGTVVDSQTGEPLPRAMVGVAGTTTGVVADERGRFELALPSGEVHLVVSFLGYKTLNVPVTDPAQYLRVRLEVSPVQLSEVVVAGYGANRRLLETAGAVAIIPAEVLERANPMFMQQALESVPGVRMEMSNPNQQRLSIRGVGVRAHNSGGIRTFINDIPLTEAEGSTNFSQIDVTTLGQIEILKGPSSSLYGAGMGGVVNLRTRRAPYLQQFAELTSLAGSDGLRRIGGSYQAGTNSLNLLTSYGRSDYDGFREHDRHKRDEFNLVAEFYPGDRNTISVLASRVQSWAQLAGGVDEEAFRAQPRSANATSVRQNVNQDNAWTRIGVSNTHEFSDRFSNTTVVHNSFGALDHPVSTAVLRNTTHTFGARTRFTYRAPTTLALRPRLIVGGEFMQGLTLRKRYENLGGGQAGLLIGDTEQTTPYYNLFAQAEADLTDRSILTLGLSYNHASLRVLDLRNPDLSARRAFDPTLSPRLALNHRITDHVSAHASVSHGFLPPPANRVINADGSVNLDMNPETAVNYEVGLRGLVLDDRLNFDLSVYSLRMRDELIPRNVAEGVTVWVNAGRTTHNGFETALWYDVVRDETGFFHSIRPYLAYAYSDFTFSDFVVAADDYTGNAITGTSPHSYQLGVDVLTRPGAYGSIRHSFTDRMPLNDTNTAFADAYRLLNAKFGFAGDLGRVGLDAYVGVDNLLDERYSSRLNFNAGGGHYFQPSPGRIFYTGLSVRPRL